VTVIESGQVCFDDMPRCKHVCAYGVYIVSIFDVNRREIAVNLAGDASSVLQGTKRSPERMTPKNDSPDPYAQ